MKILVVSPDKEELSQLSNQVSTDIRDVVSIEGGDIELASAVERHQPRVLVVDGVYQENSSFDRLEKSIQANPGMAVVMLSKTLSPEFLLRMMRMGVTEVLPQPATAAAVRDSIARASQRTSVAQKSRRSLGKVIAMVGCKGGSGVTFIAANLAYAVAVTHPDTKVALIDLNLQGGDAELFVSDKRSNSSVASIATEIQRLDGTLLESSMVKILPNFGVLAAVQDTHEALSVKPDHVSQLIDVAAQNYDLVLLDLPRSVDPRTIKALDRANEICMVMQMTLPFIRDAKKLLSDFRSLGYGPDKIHLVVNRYEAEPDITLKDVQQTLGMHVYRTIPNSYRNVAASVNQGVPIAKLAPRDPVARTMMEMAAVQLNQPGKAGEARAESRGWLSALRGR